MDMVHRHGGGGERRRKPARRWGKPAWEAPLLGAVLVRWRVSGGLGGVQDVVQDKDH